MMINDQSKRLIPFRAHDAKRVGADCFYLDSIVWLNGANISLGERVKFNYGCWVNGYGGLDIDDDSAIGPGVMIHTANHITDDLESPIADQGWVTGPVRIGRNCWIGMGAIILPGVTLAEGVIVGAGAVVTKDLDAFTVNVGNPARPVKSRHS